jgi:hypothetical protein
LKASSAKEPVFELLRTIGFGAAGFDVVVELGSGRDAVAPLDSRPILPGDPSKSMALTCTWSAAGPANPTPPGMLKMFVEGGCRPSVSTKALSRSSASGGAGGLGLKAPSQLSAAKSSKIKPAMAPSALLMEAEFILKRIGW